MKAYLIEAWWFWTGYGPFLIHTAYFFALTPEDILARLARIRGLTYWKEPPMKIGEGMCGRSILFTEYYVHEVDL